MEGRAFWGATNHEICDSLHLMDAVGDALAAENATLKAELAVARAKASEDAALIAQQTLRIAKLERQVYGQKSERSTRLIDQLALTFEELAASVACHLIGF